MDEPNVARIENRGAGQWQLRVRKRGYPDVSRTFDKCSKAERWAKKIETEMDDMEFISRKEAERTSLKQLLERYRDEISAQKKGVASSRGWVSSIHIAHGLVIL